MLKSRLAPTPSGFLHIGNAYNFLFTFLLVQKHQGKLVLRIDDMDVKRVKPCYIDDLFDILKWLGIFWDYGPQNASEVEQFSQQNRLSLYYQYLEQLKKSDQLYACNCNKNMLQLPFADVETCLSKNLPFTGNCSWRFISKKEPISFYDYHTKQVITVAEEDAIFNPILKRKDGLPAYQLTSLIDDIEHDINVIVRGKDLIASTSLQLALSQSLNLHSFNNVKFYHHPLVIDEFGKKLSKSAGSYSLKEFRLKFTVQHLYRGFASWLGVTEASNIETMEELIFMFNQLPY
jgi:glutamyl/glutaminyl-tRNA synthetase